MTITTIIKILTVFFYICMAYCVILDWTNHLMPNSLFDTTVFVAFCLYGYKVYQYFHSGTELIPYLLNLTVFLGITLLFSIPTFHRMRLYKQYGGRTSMSADEHMEVIKRIPESKKKIVAIAPADVWFFIMIALAVPKTVLIDLQWYVILWFLSLFFAYLNDLIKPFYKKAKPLFGGAVTPSIILALVLLHFFY